MNKIIKFLIAIIIFFVVQTKLISEVRYVSKTGGNIAPYTSWVTACDSLQKCLNYCLSGDTVYVDRGIYKETIYVNKKDLTIIGVDADECVIDGTGIDGQINTVYFINVLCVFDSCNSININNITLKKKSTNEAKNYKAISIRHGFLNLNGVNIDSTQNAVGLHMGCDIQNCIFKDILQGINVGDYTSDGCYNISNNLMYINYDYSYPQGIGNSIGGGNFNITNNIIIKEAGLNNYRGIDLASNKKIFVSNNLISGFRSNIYIISEMGVPEDTTYILNNILLNSTYYVLMTSNLFDTGKEYVIKNNIFANNANGLYCYYKPEEPDYNMYYNNGGVLFTNVNPGVHDTIADPMFVKDTLVNLSTNYDYRLQKFSPAIDRGDPNILDIDGSRSDLGMYGGPLGKKYIYNDYAPKPAKGLKAVYQGDTSRVKLTWKRNTESDFAKYYIYKDINPNFVIDSTKRIGITTDSLFYDNLQKGTLKVYYKLTAVDNTNNQSYSSTEVNVTITENEEVTITENMEYALYQNYPNPFNPSTTISYNLKDQSEVRIKLYTITGELIKTLNEGVKAKGYSETKIDMSGYSSGIYLYKIEVTGNGKIPVFSDLEKMMLLK